LERNFSKSRLQVDALFLSLTAAGIIQLLKNSESTEFANIGAGISGRFKNTKELKVMNYKEAVSGPDGERWKAGVKIEYQQILAIKVFDVVLQKDLPLGTTLIDSIWAMNKNSNGTLCG
jgi:hypothetical protein